MTNLFALIWNTKESTPRLYKETFGQKPNVDNLRALFQDEAIRLFWFGSDAEEGKCKMAIPGFRNSPELRDFLKNLSTEERRQLIQHFSRFGEDILPF